MLSIAAQHLMKNMNLTHAVNLEIDEEQRPVVDQMAKESLLSRSHSYSNRTGPAVRPLKDRTEASTGLVHLKDRPCN